METITGNFIVCFTGLLGDVLPSVVFGVTETMSMETIVKHFILTFASIVWEAMPFIVFGAVIAGILEEFLPQQLITRILPSQRFLAIAISCFLGIVFPMCECGIIVVMRRLLRKGLPLSCCVAYMLAGPIINPVVMISTYAAFQNMDENSMNVDGRLIPQFGSKEMTIARVGLGFLTAFCTGLFVEWQYRKHGAKKLLLPIAMGDLESNAEGGEEGQERQPFLRRAGNITETAIHDFVDITVFLILGALLAALSRVTMDQNQIDVGKLSHGFPVLTILVMMSLAVLLCLCSEADAFVAASYSTLAPAAKLSFLVLGPMLDFKLYFMYTRVFRARLIWTIIPCVVLQVLVYSMITHYVWLHFPQSWRF